MPKLAVHSPRPCKLPPPVPGTLPCSISGLLGLTLVLAACSGEDKPGSGSTGGTHAGGSTAGSSTGGSAGGGGTTSGGNAGATALELGELRKAAARAGKLIGAAVNATALRDDPEYAPILAREFDYVTPENATKWGPLAPTADSYAWQDADAILEFAEKHGQAIKGHTFVWHRQTPSWVVDTMSAEELRAALKLHIETTLARYRGRIRAWDVVNEAVDMNTASHYTESIFWQKLGPEYIEDAFRWARAADPDVLLFYNEVGIERMGPKSDFTYGLMRDLLAKGVPIDGIGFQSHISQHRYPAESNLRANIQRFAELGLKVNISELDVRTILMPGTVGTRWPIQRVAFQQVVGACVAEPACEGVTLWGFTDKYSWINDEGDPDDPLIFDRNYKAKPAYDGVLDGLAGKLPVAGENLIRNASFAAGVEDWSALGGELTVGAAEGRAGAAACVSGRAELGHGLVQSSLTAALAAGGPFSFSAAVRLRGAASDTVQATLLIQEEGLAARELSLGNVMANDAGWGELAGYFALGYAATPTSIDLKIHGPAAAVDVCAAEVALRPLSPGAP